MLKDVFLKKKYNSQRHIFKKILRNLLFFLKERKQKKFWIRFNLKNHLSLCYYSLYSLYWAVFKNVNTYFDHNHISEIKKSLKKYAASSIDYEAVSNTS